MMKKNALSVLLLFSAAVFRLCGGEDVQTLQNLEIPAGKQVFTDMFKLEKGKNYEFTGLAVCGKNAGRIVLDVRFYDLNRRLIHPHFVNALKGAETRLLKPAKKGEKSFFVADNPLWENYKKYRIVVFNARQDLSDLPNRFCEYYVSKCEKTKEGVLVTLSNPLSRNYPANMLVRLHGDGGWMRFKPSIIGASAKGIPFKFSAEWAKVPGYDPRHFWDGAVWARIFCKSQNNCKLENIKISVFNAAVKKNGNYLNAESVKKIEAEKLRKRTAFEYLENADLHAAVKPFRAQKFVKKSDGMEIITSGRKCGFFQVGLNWQADKIKQLEFTVKSDTPGFMALSYGAKVNGKYIKTPSNLLPRAIIPDGKYHTVIFDVFQDPRWQGIITNWEISWHPDTHLARVQDGVQFGLQRVHASAVNNRIPDVKNIKPGEQALIKTLFPRTKCRLFWQNGSAPEVTLRALDHNMQAIPDWQVKLPATGKYVDFTCHENMVWGVLSVNSAASGEPVISQLDEYCRPYGPKIKWRGNWIWSQKEQGPEFHNVWFEKEFVLDSSPLFGAVAFMGDDQCYIYVNGHFAGSTGQFRVAGRSAIGQYLKKGKNKITARVFNETQNAGLVINCYVKTQDKELYIDTDKTWLCDPVSNQHKQIPQKIDRPVFDLGNANTTKPWAGKTDTRYAGPCGVLDILELHPGWMTVKVLDKPAETIELIRFKLTTQDGKARFVELPVFFDSNPWKKNDIVKIKFNVPYWSGKAFKLEAEGNDYIQLTGKTLLNIPARPRRKAELQQAKFVKQGLRTMLQLGGKIIEPVFWHGGSAANRRHWYEFDIARRSNVSNFRLTASFMNYWKGHDQYDFTLLDEKLDQVFAISPDAVITLQLYCIMPDWWLNENPDDATVLFNNPQVERTYDRQALGSKKWIRDSEKPIRALIAHLKNSPYADRFWSMTFCENGNGEWFWWRYDRKNRPAVPGFSKADHATFRSYLKEKYSTDAALAAAWKQPGVTIETDMMPDPSKALKGAINTLLDPEKDMQIIDWYIFRNRVLGEAVIHFAKTAKEASGGKLLTGAYYGYFTELSENYGWKLQIAGHNAFLEVAKSPYVDFVQAPSRYAYRKVGMSDHIMQPFDTYLLYGKQVFCEQDIRTATGPLDRSRTYASPGDTVADSIGQLNRALGMMLATGTEMYYYDISKGALYDKVFRRTIVDQQNFLKKQSRRENLIPPEVAVIGHRDSAYMIKAAGGDGVFTGAVSGLFRRINELAIPYRSFSLDELLDDKITVPAHKVYIMLPTLVLSQKERERLLNRFEKESASVVWLYAAAPFYPGKTPSAKNNADFLGVKYRMQKGLMQPEIQLVPEWGGHRGKNMNITGPWFYPESNYDKVLGKDHSGQAVLVSKKIRKSTHYLSTLTNLPMAFYSKLLKDSGVRNYVETQNDPVWVGNNVLFIHAKSSGRKTLNLPENCQAKGVIGPCRNTLKNNESFDAVVGQTYGFSIEPEK